MATDPVFRVETYRLAAGDFPGRSYRLHLRHTLSANYFVMMQWQVANSGSFSVGDACVRVSEDPYGTGDLALAGGNWLTLYRESAVAGAVDVIVTVVECLRNEDGAGFRLRDVKVITLADHAGIGVQSTTATSSGWTNLARVVLFGGRGGGGLSSVGATGVDDYQTAGTKVFPTLSSTVNVDRYGSTNAKCELAEICVYVVEWGMEWIVQRSTVTGTNSGATLALAGHYSTAVTSLPVLRARTWVWGCGYTDGSGPGDSAAGQVYTLGDGVTQNATENAVACGSAFAVGVRSWEVYVLTHRHLSTAYGFKVMGAPGTYTFPVSAPAVGADESFTAGTLYAQSVGYQRFGLLTGNGIVSNSTAEMGEAFYATFLTGATTLEARTRDPAAGLNWAGWMVLADFASLTVASDSLPVFRTTTYRLAAGVFTGPTYDLALQYELSANYFVVIEGAEAVNANADPDDVSVFISQDPFGTGDLNPSLNARTIRLARTGSSQTWQGRITVVECQRGSTTAGFRLVDVRTVALPAFADTGVQQVTSTLNNTVTWTTPDQVTLFTGWRGPGVETVGAHAAGDAQSLGVAAVPAGDNTIQLYRYTNNATKAKAVNAVVFAVEWGSEWTVQALVMMGAAGGAGVAAPADYLVATLTTTVVSAHTWVWGAVTAEDDETQHSFLSGAIHLGDGVSQAASEDRVALGLWSADAYLAVVFALTHPDLRTDWVFQGSTASTFLSVAVDPPIRGESYQSAAPVSTMGYRLGLAYTAASDATATAFGGAAVFARHNDFATMALTRLRNDGNWAGWAQSADFGGIMAAVGAVQVDDSVYPAPSGYLILQDPHWNGADSVVSVTNEGGRLPGPVVPLSTNQGIVVGFQEGTPSADTELEFSLTGGGVGASGGYLYRLSTETTSADWKGLNALTALWRQQSTTSIGDPPTSSLYASDVAYSTTSGRLLLAYIRTADGTIRVDYQDANSPLATWTNTSIAVSGVELADDGTQSGLGMCELPDGSLLMAYQIEDSSSGYKNINILASTNGGTSWDFRNRRILSKTTLGGRSATGGCYLVRSSGDWVRIAFLDDPEPYTASGENTLLTVVSADRGASWAAVGTGLPVFSWTATTGPFGTIPLAMVGLGDASGTFLLAYQDVGASTSVNIAIAARADDWAEVTALAIDISGYATSPVCKGATFVRDPDRLWLFLWVEGTDASEMIAVVCTNPTDPENSDSWLTMGTISGFAGVLAFGPHNFRGVWAGNRIALSGGIFDPTTAALSDPLIDGHWMVQSGSWDPQPWDYTLLDPYFNDYFIGGHRVVGYQWIPCGGGMVGPGADPLTPWTQVTAGVVTTTFTANSGRFSTADATGQNCVQLLPDTTDVKDRWGEGRHALHFRMKTESVRGTLSGATNDVGVSVRALDAAAANVYDFAVRISPIGIALWDQPIATVAATQATTDFASECELRIGIRTGGLVTVSWRLKSAAPLGAWSSLPESTLTLSGAFTVQRLRVGILGAPGAGISTVNVYDIATSYETDAGQCDDVSKPTHLMGTRMNRGAILVANGMRLRWGGSGAFEGDFFTAGLEYSRGVPNLSLSSPRFYLESQDASAWEAIFASSSLSTSTRWHMDALLLVGTVDRTCTLNFSNTNTPAAWAAPAASVELSADLYTDLTVVAIDGSSLQLEAASGDTFAPARGAMIGAYIRFVTAGAATGMTLRVKNDVHDDRWFHVDDGVDLLSEGVSVGAKAVLFGDRMVYLGSSFQRYRFFQLSFPDVSSVVTRGTYTGTHRIGSMVPGFHQRLTVPLEWSFRDNEQPNATELRTRGGATWQYEEGPAQRVVGGRIVGDVDEFRRSLRDMLREIHGYVRTPVGLVTTSSRISRETTVFGTFTSGSQMDEAAWYLDSEGEWRTAGDTDIYVTEEV